MVKKKNLIELHTYRPNFVLELSERPIASPTARLQAQNGLPVTNLYHKRVAVDEASRHLLGYLDGSRDRAALVEALIELERNEIITVHQDDQPVKDAELIRHALAEGLDSQLHQIGQAGLLVG